MPLDMLNSDNTIISTSFFSNIMSNTWYIDTEWKDTLCIAQKPMNRVNSI